jgi:hypothetical protein
MQGIESVRQECVIDFERLDSDARTAGQSSIVRSDPDAEDPKSLIFKPQVADAAPFRIVVERKAADTRTKDRI